METVHEEDLSLTNDLQDDNSDCTDATNSMTSTIELGVAADYTNSTSTSTNSLAQNSDNHTLKNTDDLGASSTSFETTKSENTAREEDQEFKSNDCQLYEQLSQMKPLKLLNFKSSTSICLVNKPETQADSFSAMPMIDETLDAKSPCEQNESKMSSSSTSSLSSSSSNNHSENADSPSNALNDELSNKNVKNDVSSSSSTCSFGSSGYHSDNSKQQQQLVIQSDITELKTEQTANGVATSMMVIPRRNSTNSSQSGSNATRRVSLSVTDL